ncbi:hypothetical protein NQ176_g7698 [Zarea fungicola]|uniref:Uncharacterized protein n=1 Tax=Zarea fungicola TaxID=93591 RepID=A0ACC1MWN7_9HYPO|nr:hypothetical protein NQ176_g7698 [Lecanicillium fungicola]
MGNTQSTSSGGRSRSSKPRRVETAPAYTAFPTLEQAKAAEIPLEPIPERKHRYHMAYRNQTCSGLCRLPDNVLITIMLLLPPPEMVKLRHVSRDFMRLFSECVEFQQYHLTKDDEQYAPMLWAAPNPTVKFPDQAHSQFPPLCTDCAMVRKTDYFGRELLLAMPRLHCSGCKREHRSLHFSFWQRKELEHSRRLCIGHEGACKLDDSFFFTWQHMKFVAPTQIHPYVCDNDETAPNKCSKDLCRHKHLTTAQFRLTSDGKLQAQFSHTTHIPFRRGIQGKVDILQLDDTMEEFDRSISKQAVCLSPWEHEADLFRAFDPNVCDCVAWHDSPLQFRSVTAREFKWQLAPPGRLPDRRHQPGGYVGKQGRCMGKQHGVTVTAPGIKYEADYFVCPDDDNLLALRLLLTCTVESASDPGWQTILHPGSYLQCLDTEMRGVTWCNNYSCGLFEAQFRHKSLVFLEQQWNLGN